MIKLPNACYCSELKVNPKTWLSKKTSIKNDWFIYYRFYDPSLKDNPKYRKGKLVKLRGMNHFRTIPERTNQTEKLIKQELDKLIDQVYNPITGSTNESKAAIGEIDCNTPLISALQQAEKRISCSTSSKRDLRSILRYVTDAAEKLGYSNLPVGTISRKYYKQILLYIDSTHGESAHRYNKVRSYLMIIYKELVELEVVDSNPLKDISKRKTIQRLRKLPSEENRQIINDSLRSNHYRFWLFMQIFFHSGARLTEVMLIKRKDVNIQKQLFVITIKKGSFYKEVGRPIKNIALSFWMEAIANASEEDYIFSKDLMPGKDPVQSYQITKRWNRHVKQKLGINEDFYSLKHLNIDQTASILGLSDASAMASHSSTAVTLKHYAVNEASRQNERLKQVSNSFA